MKGIVVFWPGAIADIPAGWHLCDGTDGTPDYRNCYLAGAGDLYNPGDSFGSDTQQHAFTGDGHSHNILSGSDIENVSPAGNYGYGVSTSGVTGTTNPADNRPQTKAGCWIIKL